MSDHPLGLTTMHLTAPKSRPAMLLLAALAGLLAAAQSSAANFAGRWDLTLTDHGKHYPSWIEIKPNGAAIAVTLVGTTGSARELPPASISHGNLLFTAPPEDSTGQPQTYTATFHGSSLEGTVAQQNQPPIPFTGRRAPSLQRPTTPHWSAPRPLITGTSFQGWHFSSPAHTNWSVANGTLTTTGHGADLISNATFTDFTLSLDWQSGPNSNSGIYLRGRYEVQVETDSAAEPPSHHTGGIYGFLAPQPEQPRQPNTWQHFDITLVGRTVTVAQNGHVILNHQEIPGITGGALDSDEAAPGPLVLQGSESGTIAYRNILIRQPIH